MARNNTVHLNLNVRGLPPSATLAINEKSSQLQAEGKKVYRLGLGQSPFPVPERVVQSLRDNAHQKSYLPVKGLPELREAVSSFNERTQGINTHPDHILIGPGSKELIFLLQLVYYGDLVIPTPSWVSYSPQARIVGRHVYWAPTFSDNFWRLSPEQLENICRSDPDKPRIAILNYPSNPSGYSYPLERLKELARVARKYRVILVSDEIYGLLHFKNQHVSVARFYPEGTIISSGLSKWCGAGGWRLGTFSFPPELDWLCDAMSVVASETYTSTSAPIQYAAISAFQGGVDIDEYLHLARKILRTIAKFMIGSLNNIGIEIAMTHGGFYLFPDFGVFREKLNLRDIYTSMQLCRKILEETGVALLPGNEFGRDPSELTARIAFVDFDGSAALRAAKEYGERELNDHYLSEYVPRVKEATVKLTDWFRSL